MIFGLLFGLQLFECLEVTLETAVANIETEQVDDTDDEEDGVSGNHVAGGIGGDFLEEHTGSFT